MWLYLGLTGSILGGIFSLSKIHINYAGTSMSILDIISMYTLARLTYTREHRNISTIVQLDKHTYEIIYNIYGKKYRMIVKPHRGPRNIYQILTDTGVDVTDLVLEYAGPEFNWHGSVFTPRSLGFERLDVELIDGTVVTYGVDEQILGKY